MRNRQDAREVGREPAPSVISHAENDRYGSSVESNRPFPVARKERVPWDELDVEIVDSRVPGEPGLGRAAEVVVRSVAVRNARFNGDDVHGEAVLDQAGLAVVRFVIAIERSPQNSVSCVEIELAVWRGMRRTIRARDTLGQADDSARCAEASLAGTQGGSCRRAKRNLGPCFKPDSRCSEILLPKPVFARKPRGRGSGPVR
jgi:hypothetical protein